MLSKLVLQCELGAASAYSRHSFSFSFAVRAAMTSVEVLAWLCADGPDNTLSKKSAGTGMLSTVICEDGTNVVVSLPLHLGR